MAVRIKAKFVQSVCYTLTDALSMPVIASCTKYRRLTACLQSMTEKLTESVPVPMSMPIPMLGEACKVG